MYLYRYLTVAIDIQASTLMWQLNFWLRQGLYEITNRLSNKTVPFLPGTCFFTVLPSFLCRYFGQPCTFTSVRSLKSIGKSLEHSLRLIYTLPGLSAPHGLSIIAEETLSLSKGRSSLFGISAEITESTSRHLVVYPLVVQSIGCAREDNPVFGIR